MITQHGIAVPDDMAAALQAVDGALETFESLRSTRQREYVDWVGKSATPETRSERLAELASHVMSDSGAVTGG